ncbi:GDP-mannose 4,6-dehydratase [Shewanella benthica]|uniref:GDP-mannose 4,6-dehydratase n=1 Tax=Shewanella benthica TaxID=43661 RepID=UPI001D0D6BB7|nr:GDP-mannose 4,6-dehydratase [Shewanella benthica]MCL1061825.1 GDP-mannose 4,6-dehydratase [Shewanella benthica]
MGIPSKKVLITGIDGFTGIYLKQHMLSLGYQVFGTVRGTPDTPEQFQMELTDPRSIERVLNTIKPDYIVHLAAISFVGHDDTADFYRINVIGTENLLQGIINADLAPEKVLIASSANVYGNSRKTLISEDTPCEPVNHYACSKLAMEKIVANYFDKLNIIITRPFNYTGPGQAEHFLVPKIVTHFKRNAQAIELGNLDVSRDYSSVVNVVDAYEKLLVSPTVHTIVNVCSGVSVSLLEIVDTMKELTQQKMAVKVNQNFVRKDEIKTITGDNSKLVSIIGTRTNQSLSQLLESFI